MPTKHIYLGGIFLSSIEIRNENITFEHKRQLISVGKMNCVKNETNTYSRNYKFIMIHQFGENNMELQIKCRTDLFIVVDSRPVSLTFIRC